MRAGVGQNRARNPGDVFVRRRRILAVAERKHQFAEMHDRRQAEKIVEGEEPWGQVDDIDRRHPADQPVCDPVSALMDRRMGGMGIPRSQQSDGFELRILRGESEQCGVVKDIGGEGRAVKAPLNVFQGRREMPKIIQIADKDFRACAFESGRAGVSAMNKGPHRKSFLKKLKDRRASDMSGRTGDENSGAGMHRFFFRTCKLLNVYADIK